MKFHDGTGVVVVFALVEFVDQHLRHLLLVTQVTRRPGHQLARATGRVRERFLYRPVLYCTVLTADDRWCGELSWGRPLMCGRRSGLGPVESTRRRGGPERCYLHAPIPPTAISHAKNRCTQFSETTAQENDLKFKFVIDGCACETLRSGRVRRRRRCAEAPSLTWRRKTLEALRAAVLYCSFISGRNCKEGRVVGRSPLSGPRPVESRGCVYLVQYSRLGTEVRTSTMSFRVLLPRRSSSR